MRGRKYAALVLALALVGRSTPARSGEPESAAELLRAGVELRKAHDDRSALAAFERANALAPSPMARAQMALARAALGEWLAAEEDMHAALEASNDPWIARNRVELDKVAATIAEHLGWLEIDVDVAGAELTLDGRALKERRSRASAGHGELQVRAAGYAPDVRVIAIPAKGTAQVRVTLTPLTAPPPDAPRAFAPSAASPPPEPARPSRAAPLAVGALGLVSVGVGVYFGARAFSDLAARNEHCEGRLCTQGGIDADSDGRMSADVSTVSIAIGAALVVTSLAWLVLQRPQHPAPTALLRRGPVNSFEITQW